MATIEVSDIADLVASTRREEGIGKMTDLSFELQKHLAMNRLMKNHAVTEDGGEQLQFNLMYQTSGAARAVGLYSVDESVTGDVLTKGRAPWRNVETKFFIDLHEPAINSGSDKKILNFVDVKRHDANVDLAKLHEAHFWSKPATSSDELTPFGIDLYIIPFLSYSADGWVNAENPVGFSSGVCNIDTTTYTGWANWAAQYTAVTQTDAIRRIIKALYKTGFESAVPNPPIPDYNTGNQYEMYSNWNFTAAARDLLRAQNDNLSRKDIAGIDVVNGQIVIHGIPIICVPYLDEDNDSYSDMATRDPIYGVNWGVAQFTYLEGWMNREKTGQAPNQHNVACTWRDTSYQLVMRDRRRLFIVATA